jgi:hypothetical protein
MKKIHQNLLKFFESKILVGILYGMGIILAIILIFLGGFSVGFKKASFNKAWSENYERNFGRKPNQAPFGKNDFPNAHGAVGEIIKIELPNIVVQDKDNTEKIITINENTTIQKGKETIKSSDLKIDDLVVIIGAPNSSGQIEAKFIRIMPAGMPNPPMPR